MSEQRARRNVRRLALPLAAVLVAAAVIAGGTVAADAERGAPGPRPSARIREARAALPVGAHRVAATLRRDRGGLYRGTLAKSRRGVPDFTTYADAQAAQAGLLRLDAAPGGG